MVSSLKVNLSIEGSPGQGVNPTIQSWTYVHAEDRQYPQKGGVSGSYAVPLLAQI